MNILDLKREKIHRKSAKIQKPNILQDLITAAFRQQVETGINSWGKLYQEQAKLSNKRDTDEYDMERKYVQDYRDELDFYNGKIRQQKSIQKQQKKLADDNEAKFLRNQAKSWEQQQRDLKAKKRKEYLAELDFYRKATQQKRMLERKRDNDDENYFADLQTQQEQKYEKQLNKKSIKKNIKYKGFDTLDRQMKTFERGKQSYYNNRSRSTQPKRKSSSGFKQVNHQQNLMEFQRLNMKEKAIKKAYQQDHTKYLYKQMREKIDRENRFNDDMNQNIRRKGVTQKTFPSIPGLAIPEATQLRKKYMDMSKRNRDVFLGKPAKKSFASSKGIFTDRKYVDSSRNNMGNVLGGNHAPRKITRHSTSLIRKKQQTPVNELDFQGYQSYNKLSQSQYQYNRQNRGIHGGGSQHNIINHLLRDPPKFTYREKNRSSIFN